MSSAANHRKRSHKSHYRTRGFNGSRRSVITPSLNKNASMKIINRIAKFLSKKKGESENA